MYIGLYLTHKTNEIMYKPVTICCLTTCHMTGDGGEVGPLCVVLGVFVVFVVSRHSFLNYDAT